MTNLRSLVLCLLLYVQFDKVFSKTKLFYNDDKLVVEGDNCNSSEINALLIDRNISTIHVHLTNVFYADEDMKLNQTRELHILANTFHCVQPVTFDLSGSDGALQEPSKVKGSPGQKGNEGANGGNIFILTNRTINGDYLRVTSNGGNGGNGQAGTASDDVYVLFNEGNDAGDKGWFSSGDLHSYYEKYFSDRGYDAEITDIDDYTSFYALFVHDKRANFNVRLYPRKCCGTTGIGGAGGHGGRPGAFVFKHLHYVVETEPTFVGNDGQMGMSGKDGEACQNRAMNVRVDVEIENVVFIILPLHHSFSSKFTVLNHTDSSKCLPEFVRDNDTTVAKTIKPNEMNVAAPTVLYKTFLLEQMKNESVQSIAEEMYKAIDDNEDVDGHFTLKEFLLEATNLEKRSPELMKAIDIEPLYRRLYNRVGNMEILSGNADQTLGQRRLESILHEKLNDLNGDITNYIVDLEGYTELAVSMIERRARKPSTMMEINDVDLLRLFHELHTQINGHYILSEYNHVIKAFQLTYFPFAVEYSVKYDMSMSLTDYENLDIIQLNAVNRIKALNQSIGQIKWNNADITMNIIGIVCSHPRYAFFVWKYADVRDHIPKLFAGETISLTADVKQSKSLKNAMKFKKIQLYFRSSEQNVTDELQNALKFFKLKLKHNGRSQYRCDNSFYQIITEPLSFFFSFAKNENGVPVTRTSTYDKLRNNQPMISPFATWEIQIVSHRSTDFTSLAAFAKFSIDIELHGTGNYVSDHVPICENNDLAKIYAQV